jgi:hypothetical protein
VNPPVAFSTPNESEIDIPRPVRRRSSGNQCPDLTSPLPIARSVPSSLRGKGATDEKEDLTDAESSWAFTGLDSHVTASGSISVAGGDVDEEEDLTESTSLGDGQDLHQRFPGKSVVSSHRESQ